MRKTKAGSISPPFRPDMRLQTFLYDARPEEEMWAILEGATGPLWDLDDEDAAPEEAT